MAEDEGRHEPEHGEADHHAEPGAQKGKTKRWLDNHKLAVISVALGVLGILVVLWMRSRSSSASASTIPSGAVQGSNAPGSSGGGGGSWWPGTGTGATSNPGSTTPNVTVNVPQQPAPVVNLTVAPSTGGGSSGAAAAKKTPVTTTPKAKTVSTPTSEVLSNPTGNPSATVRYIAQASHMPTVSVPSYVGEPLGPGTPVISHAASSYTPSYRGTPLGPGTPVISRSASVVTQSKSPAKATTSKAHALAGQTSLTQAQALQI